MREHIIQAQETFSQFWEKVGANLYRTVTVMRCNALFM
jgi:hypothetical protein